MSILILGLIKHLLFLQEKNSETVLYPRNQHMNYQLTDKTSCPNLGRPLIISHSLFSEMSKFDKTCILELTKIYYLRPTIFKLPNKSLFNIITWMSQSHLKPTTPRTELIIFLFESDTYTYSLSHVTWTSNSFQDIYSSFN